MFDLETPKLWTHFANERIRRQTDTNSKKIHSELKKGIRIMTKILWLWASSQFHASQGRADTFLFVFIYLFIYFYSLNWYCFAELAYTDSYLISRDWNFFRGFEIQVVEYLIYWSLRYTIAVPTVKILSCLASGILSSAAMLEQTQISQPTWLDGGFKS